MSDLERAFDTIWKQLGGEAGQQEYRFAPPRRWRFDRAWPAERVAVELEGGVWSKGRHVRPAGFEADVEKYNAATAHGWRVFRITAKMLKEDPVGCLKPVLQALDLGWTLNEIAGADSRKPSAGGPECPGEGDG